MTYYVSIIVDTSVELLRLVNVFDDVDAKNDQYF